MCNVERNYDMNGYQTALQEMHLSHHTSHFLNCEYFLLQFAYCIMNYDLRMFQTFVMFMVSFRCLFIFW